MKISIVVPARNEERFIASCLRSLKDQTYKGNYEIIVVDNCSTDKTAEIARGLGVKVVPAHEQKNVFYARQVGANTAEGDIIVQADSDTLYPRRWLQKIAAKFEVHPEAVAVAGRFLYRDKFTWAFVELNVRNLMNKISTALFGRPFLVSGATFAFRREAFIKVGGYKDLPYSADQHGITTRLRRVGKILYDPKIYVLTSARSVNKPCFILLMAVIGNLARLMLDFGTNLIASRPRVRQIRLRKKVALGLAAALACIIGFSAYGYFSPISPIFGIVYYHADVTEKVVALTFDDGPNEPYTSHILDILGDYQIKATFFVIGKNVELYPDVAKRIVAEGHTLGNHSYSHDANHALSAYGSRDLEKAQETIFNITGVQPHLYRPPHGKKTPWQLDCVKKNNLIEVNWSVSYNDQVAPDADQAKAAASFAENIVKRTMPGSIILLHDGYGTTHNTPQADKSFTVRALTMIIEQLQSKGYRFVTVPVLLQVPAYNEAG